MLIGASGTLAFGTKHLTLSADFDSAQWRIGNAFNRRAGVTGTGLIRAPGAPVQTITGSAITNVATTTPTLTIGNVRVGAPTTYDFQVGNGGTGPALLGAVQTTVNGATLTDPQLSFTVGNFGPGTGTLTGGGTTYSLNLGTLMLGSGPVNGVLSLRNQVAGPADHLAGTFDLSALGGFNASGFVDPTGLGPGGELDGLTLSFDPFQLGLFTGRFTFDGRSTNAFQSPYDLARITVELEANVVIPLPAAGWLLLSGLAGLGWLARRRSVAVAA